MNDIERAWAAGFFDGEGTTSAVKRTGALILSVGQVNRDNLFRFQRAVGGLGHVHGARSLPERLPISRFAANGPEAQAVLAILWPFLGEEKQHQALRALLRYACRGVDNKTLYELGRCARGHALSTVGMYVAPDGERACMECRRLRRVAPMRKPQRPRAIEFGIGIREYAPAPYQPAVET